MKTFLQFKNAFKLFAACVALAGIQDRAVAQLSLPAGTSYTQNFDAISSGLPTGWTIRTTATATTRGTSGSFTTTATSWADSGGVFKNLASSDGLTSASNATAQSNSTDRALGLRQSGSFGDPGAAFELSIANTTGKTAFTLAMKHQLLDSQARSVTWSVQYSLNTGTSWTTLGTFADPGTFGSTNGAYNFGSALDNLGTGVLIRVVALTASSGSGSRDAYAIDDFVLSWTTAATVVSTSSLTDFGSVNTGSASASQNFTVSGTNLGANNIVIAAPSANFQVSTDDATWVQTINLTPTAGTVGTTTIYARFTPQSTGVKSGNITIDATGVSQKTVAVSGTGTSAFSNASDIIADAGFTYTQNIPYGSFQSAAGLTTSNSLEAAHFTIRDGGATTDADASSTTLTSVSFSLSNASNLRTVALFDGTTNLGEVPAAATVNFSGLNLIAADGSVKNFSLYVTFNATVTDNQQFQFAVTAATATAGASGFAANDAGAASSSLAADNNRIEVTASQLAFAQGPSNTVINVNMTPTVTVKAVDSNNNLDLDFTSSVAVTSTGTLAASQNIAAVAGIAAFSTINHTIQQTGVVLTANASGVTGIGSGNFDITVQAAGDLLLEENFEFTGLLTANGYTVTGTTSSPNQNATAGNLSYSGYGSTGIGNSVTLATSGQDVNKTFAQQNTGSTTYAAFLVNVTSATAAGDYFLHLGPTVISSEFRGRIYARSQSGNLQFGVSSTGGTIVYSTANYTFNTTYLIVVKHFYNGTNVTSSLFVNPSLYAEPVLADITQTTAASSTNIGTIGIRQGTAASAPVLTVDGIRVATNWGTLLGNPQYDANATINAGNYNSVTVIGGTLTSAGNLTVNDNIHVDSGADLIVENNKNLIQKGSTNNNVGKITVHRTASMKRQDYVYWSSPVAGQNLLAFSSATLANRFYTLDEATNNFAAINPAVSNFGTAVGYSIRAPNDFPTTNTAFNGVFNGVPNNGDITIGVTKNNLGFNMIGNPYPSTINADTFLDANTNLNTIYFWTHAQQGAASGANYATYNQTGQAAASTTTPASATPNGTIQVAQGFMVDANASGTVVFNNSMRVNNTAGQFFRSAQIEKDRLWLNLGNENGNQNQALIGYITDATNDADSRFDGKLLELQGAKLYSVIDGNPYVIQGRALPFSAEDIVKLGFSTEIPGNFTIALDHVDGLFSTDQDIFLKDNLTGTIHDMKNGNYSFASMAGTYHNRFEVVYQNTTLGIENPSMNADNVVIFKQNETLNINSGNAVMKSVKIFDIRGRLVFERNDINSGTTAIANLNVSKQVLVVQITAMDNTTVSKKVVY